MGAENKRMENKFVNKMAESNMQKYNMNLLFKQDTKTHTDARNGVYHVPFY